MDVVEDKDLETLSHEDLNEITTGTITKILHADQLLNDLPVGVTLEEVNAQIAVIQGQSISLQVLRNQETPLNVVVPSIGSTVLDLKKAVKRSFNLHQIRNHSSTKISWKYIWRTYCLNFDGTFLNDNNSLLSSYGIKNKSQISFMKFKKKSQYL